SSVPNQWPGWGGSSRFMTSRSVGLCGAIHGTSAATRTHAPTTIAPTMSAVFRRRRLRAVSSGTARTPERALDWKVATRGSAHPDARVEDAVEEVDEEVDHYVDDRGQHRHTEDRGVVETGRHRHRVAPDARPRKDGLGQDRARQETREGQADDGHDR